MSKLGDLRMALGAALGQEKIGSELRRGCGLFLDVLTDFLNPNVRMSPLQAAAAANTIVQIVQEAKTSQPPRPLEICMLAAYINSCHA